MRWALVVIAVTGCDKLLSLQTVTPPGANSPRAIVFDNSSATTDLVGFPVLVTLG